MKTVNKFVFVAIIVLLTAMGCGTVKGLGEDIGAVGGWMTKSSNNVKNNSTK